MVVYSIERISYEDELKKQLIYIGIGTVFTLILYLIALIVERFN